MSQVLMTLVAVVWVRVVEEEVPRAITRAYADNWAARVAGVNGGPLLG